MKSFIYTYTYLKIPVLLFTARLPLKLLAAHTVRFGEILLLLPTNLKLVIIIINSTKRCGENIKHR